MNDGPYNKLISSTVVKGVVFCIYSKEYSWCRSIFPTTVTAGTNYLPVKQKYFICLHSKVFFSYNIV